MKGIAWLRSFTHKRISPKKEEATPKERSESASNEDINLNSFKGEQKFSQQNSISSSNNSIVTPKAIGISWFKGFSSIRELITSEKEVKVSAEELNSAEGLSSAEGLNLKGKLGSKEETTSTKSMSPIGKDNRFGFVNDFKKNSSEESLLKAEEKNKKILKEMFFELDEEFQGFKFNLSKMDKKIKEICNFVNKASPSFRQKILIQFIFNEFGEIISENPYDKRKMLLFLSFVQHSPEKFGVALKSYFEFQVRTGSSSPQRRAYYFEENLFSEIQQLRAYAQAIVSLKNLNTKVYSLKEEASDLMNLNKELNFGMEEKNAGVMIEFLEKTDSLMTLKSHIPETVSELKHFITINEALFVHL